MINRGGPRRVVVPLIKTVITGDELERAKARHEQRLAKQPVDKVWPPLGHPLFLEYLPSLEACAEVNECQLCRRELQKAKR